MATEILMPALSPTMEEGTLAKWLVKEGDSVSSGDIIAEIETDKATMEFEAVDEGIIGKLLVNEGTENVQVNAPIAVLVEESEGFKPVPTAVYTPTEIASEPQPSASAAAAARRPGERQHSQRRRRWNGQRGAALVVLVVVVLAPPLQPQQLLPPRPAQALDALGGGGGHRPQRDGRRHLVLQLQLAHRLPHRAARVAARVVERRAGGGVRLFPPLFVVSSSSNRRRRRRAATER